MERATSVDMGAYQRPNGHDSEDPCYEHAERLGTLDSTSSLRFVMSTLARYNRLIVPITFR
jgi:hypothetical protein